MPSQEADRVRIEVEAGGTTRVLDLVGRGDRKIRIVLNEIVFSATDVADGIERVQVNLSAMGPTVTGGPCDLGQM